MDIILISTVYRRLYIAFNFEYCKSNFLDLSYHTILVVLAFVTEVLRNMSAFNLSIQFCVQFTQKHTK